MPCSSNSQTLSVLKASVGITAYLMAPLYHYYLIPHGLGVYKFIQVPFANALFPFKALSHQPTLNCGFPKASALRYVLSSVFIHCIDASIYLSLAPCSFPRVTHAVTYILDMWQPKDTSNTTNSKPNLLSSHLYWHVYS